MTIAKALSPAADARDHADQCGQRGRDPDPPRELLGTARPARNPPSTNTNAPIAGQPIVLDPGPNQEVVYVAKHISPWPATGPNVVLTAPLAKDHAAGMSTAAMNVTLTAPLTMAHATGVTVSNPRPVISAAKATELKGLLADATAKANATPADTAGAIASAAAVRDRGRGRRRRCSSSGSALIAQLNGTPVDTTGTGVTVGAAEPGVQAIRVFNNPIVPVAHPRREVQDPRHRPRRRLPPRVDRRLRVDDPAARRRRTASTSTSGTRTSTAARAARLRPASR